MAVTKYSPWGRPDTFRECAFSYGFEMGLLGATANANPFPAESDNSAAFLEGMEEAYFRKGIDKELGFLGDIADLSPV